MAGGCWRCPSTAPIRWLPASLAVGSMWQPWLTISFEVRSNIFRNQGFCGNLHWFVYTCRSFVCDPKLHVKSGWKWPAKHHESRSSIFFSTWNTPFPHFLSKKSLNCHENRWCDRKSQMRRESSTRWTTRDISLRRWTTPPATLPHPLRQRAHERHHSWLIGRCHRFGWLSKCWVHGTSKGDRKEWYGYDGWLINIIIYYSSLNINYNEWLILMVNND